MRRVIDSSTKRKKEVSLTFGSGYLMCVPEAVLSPYKDRTYVAV